MQRKIITMEVSNEVIAMTKKGNTISEICNELGISKPSVSRIRKAAGLSNNHPTDKGGVISRTIPIEEIRKTPVKEVVQEDVPPVMIADQSIEICGTETTTAYKAELRNDFVTVDGPLVIGEVKIDQILNLANELKGVYDLVTRMKGNRFGLMA